MGVFEKGVVCPWLARGIVYPIDGRARLRSTDARIHTGRIVVECSMPLTSLLLLEGQLLPVLLHTVPEGHP